MGNVTITSVQLANGVLDDVSLESVEVTMDLPKEPEQINSWQYVDSVALGENNTLSLTFLTPPSKDYVEGLLPKTITATVNGETKSFGLTWTSTEEYPENPTHDALGKSYTYVAGVAGYAFPNGAPTITIQLQAEEDKWYESGAEREITLNGSMPSEEFLAYLPTVIKSGNEFVSVENWKYTGSSSGVGDTITFGKDYIFNGTTENGVQVTYTLRAKQTMIEMRISPNWKVQEATTRSGESEGTITWTDEKSKEEYTITIDGYTGDFSGNDYIYIDPDNAELVEYNSSTVTDKHVYRVEVTIEGENAENAEPNLSSTYGYRYKEDYDNKDNVTAASNIPESYLIDAEKGKATFAIMTVINSNGSVTFNFGEGFTFHSSTGTQHTFTLNGDAGDGRTYDMDFAEGNGSSASVSTDGKQFFTVTPPEGEKRAWAVLLLDSDDVDKDESSGVTIDTSWHSQVVVNFSSGIRYFYNSLFKNSKDQFAAVYLNRDMTAVVSEISLSPQSTPVETGLNDKAELAVTAEYKYKNAMPNVTYQWYKCDDVSGSNPVAIDGATSATYTPPTDKAGNYYYYATAKFEPFTQINGYSDEAGNVLQDYDPYGWASDAETKSPVMTLTVGEESSVEVEKPENTYNYGDTISFDYVKVNFGDSTSDDEKGTMSIYRVNDDGTEETLLGSKEISNGEPWSFTYDTANKGLSIGENTVRIKFEGNETYLPSEDTLTITLEPKEVQAVVTDKSITKVYDGNDKATVNLGFEAGAIIGDDNVTVSAPDATYSDANVGDNKTITLGELSIDGKDKDWYKVTAPTETITGSITPADQTALTISGLPDKVYVGDQFTLTASGGSGTGTLSWKVVSGPAEIDEKTGAVRVTGEGEIVIRATKEADATHNATSTEITFTANEIPYTGKYSYEISTDIGDNGAISVDRYATEGERVTITVSPDDAYKLDDLSVTANGKDVELTANGDGTFSFTMPSADVKISATFAEDPDWTEPEEPSTDVSDLFLDVAANAWYKDAVQYAYDNGLMTGVSDTEFAPEATTTRAMIVSILARLEGVTSAEAAGFADVNDEWYATAVNWAANVGVVNGYEDNTFRPNQPITREQLAAILMNYAAYKGQDVSARADLSNYTDQPSTWATETMQWAVAEGLISGVTADQLQPQGNATRAQVAAILERFLAQ
ncbi:MAG: S-layer homology domain-containing protein [Peptococcaceae bacterium]|nr:S-layer homology domain-containing protein [Peptococcaceae bacterium]